MRLASYQVAIAAPAQVVWAHLTTAQGLVRWIGPVAAADPTPGGVLRWTHANGATVVGRFERDGATTVRLVHRGLPPETVEDHQRGWTYFLGELRDALTAG